MSQYWFEEAKENDLLRMEGPLGSFFLRESNYENIIFLATGTGIAPIKAILENIQESLLILNIKSFWFLLELDIKRIYFGSQIFENKNIEIKYIPVLSRQKEDW